jgi:hypothetical protein
VVEVRVEAIDLEQKRISLALASAVKEAGDEAREVEKVRDYISRSEQASTGSMGTLGDILKKKLSG